MTPIPRTNFDHLATMTDRLGTFEHAEFATPRPEHGYCTDDVARVLLVASREPERTAELRRLEETSLRFLAGAQHIDGRFRNRMNAAGQWTDRATVDDCWGRALWALGTAASHSQSVWLRASAASLFDRSARQDSPSLRARCFAILGATELLVSEPFHPAARSLLTRCADRFAAPVGDKTWPWPEPRLAYANALIPDAMMAAGVALKRPALVSEGLALLTWLLDRQVLNGHLSVVPVGGASAADRAPAFDQQPIEVAALADACARAVSINPTGPWANGIGGCVDWFQGVNDAGFVMWDPLTGGGFDGLRADGVNRNQGAESTLALLSTLQHGRCLVAAH